jgi:hypothetical protein
MAKGRRKGSLNRGYYFRTGRGWFAKINGGYVALEHENGDRCWIPPRRLLKFRLRMCA